jgi:hypothetical protein
MNLNKLEGNDCGLLEALSRGFPTGTGEYHKVLSHEILSPAEIRSDHLPDRGLEHFRCIRLTVDKR